MILQRLEKEVLEAELPHLKPQLICNGDEDSILDLLEIFVEIVKLIDSQLLNSIEKEESTSQESFLGATSTESDLSFTSNLSSTQIRQILKKYIDELTENNSNDSILGSKFKSLIDSSDVTSDSSLLSFGNDLVSSTPITRSSQPNDRRLSSFLLDSADINTQSLFDSNDGLLTSLNTTDTAPVLKEPTEISSTSKWSHESFANGKSTVVTNQDNNTSPMNSQSTDSYILEEIEQLIERAKNGERISETSKLETILDYLRQEGIDIPSSELSSDLSLSQLDKVSISSASRKSSTSESKNSYKRDEPSYRTQSKASRNGSNYGLKVNESRKSFDDAVNQSTYQPKTAGVRLGSDEGYGTKSRSFSRGRGSYHSDTEVDDKYNASGDYSRPAAPETDHSYSEFSQFKRNSSSNFETDHSTSYRDEKFRILKPKSCISSIDGKNLDSSSDKSQKSLESEYLKDWADTLQQHRKGRKEGERRIPLRKPGERLKVQDDMEEYLAKHETDTVEPPATKPKKKPSNREIPIPPQLLVTPDDSAYVKELKVRRQEGWRKMKSQEPQESDDLYDTLSMNKAYFQKFTHHGGSESKNLNTSKYAELLKHTKKKIEQERRVAILKLSQMTKLYAKQSIRERKSQMARLHKEKDNLDQQALSIEARIQSEESKTLNNLFLTTLKLQKSAIEEGRREQQIDIKQREMLRKDNQKALEDLLKNQLLSAENEAREEQVDSGIRSRMLLESLRELQKDQFLHAFQKLESIKKQTSSNPSEFAE
ncbi:Centrosomal protein of 95 kDa [Basidiobolus ranarum]